MSKKKRYEYFERGDTDDFFERRAKKKAMRNEHKEHWKFDPKDFQYDQEDDYHEEENRQN